MPFFVILEYNLKHMENYSKEREILSKRWTELNELLNNEATYTPELEGEMIRIEARIWELNLIETTDLK